MSSVSTDQQTSQKERINFLIEQYKLLESRRDSFGRQFMQIIGFFIALLALLIGLFGKEQARILAAILSFSAVALAVIAYLGYRLGKRQNDSERVMAEIEERLTREFGGPIVNLPKGASRIGARAVIVAALVLGSSVLFIIAVWILLTN
jgi:hypothetical protein